MRKAKKREIARIEKEMDALNLSDYLLLAITKNRESFIHPHGDQLLLQRVLAGMCQRHVKLFQFFMEVIKLALGADKVEMSIEDESKPKEGELTESTAGPPGEA